MAYNQFNIKYALKFSLNQSAQCQPLRLTEKINFPNRQFASGFTKQFSRKRFTQRILKICSESVAALFDFKVLCDENFRPFLEEEKLFGRCYFFKKGSV